VIAGGRIVGAAIANCGMQFPCSVIAMLPGQVLARQSTAVDLVSAATLSSTAYRSAVQHALLELEETLAARWRHSRFVARRAGARGPDTAP